MSTISMFGSFSSCSRRSRHGAAGRSRGLVVHDQGDLALVPIGLAMCLRASAAAARLSVAAVVNGMSLSTPESNAMTGMLCVLRLLQQRTGGLAVERGEADRVRALVERASAASGSAGRRRLVSGPRT
jgi:hypothetical protein